MKLATIRTGGRTAAVRIDESQAVEVGFSDVGVLLADGDWRTIAASAAGPSHDLTHLDYAPLVPKPPKILCVGLNYRTHIAEVGLPVPQYPTLFAKFAPALIGAHDPIELSPHAAQMDWEAELALVIGAPAAGSGAARGAVAGYTIANDVTARDWQLRTSQWLQGKSFARTTPLGPVLATADEIGEGLEVTCQVNGEVMQRANTADLVFGPDELVDYISRILPLEPGDVVLTGTPGGIGYAREPQRWLLDGDQLVTRIEGIGECRNVCMAGPAQQEI